MNILIAGVHGVGKTFLASQVPVSLGLMYTSASKLIKEERSLPEWSSDKRVDEVDANQMALVSAVARHNSNGTKLLLDGHFVLLDGNGKFSPLGASVFKGLNINGVILLEAAPELIAARISCRDGRHINIEGVEKFLSAERAQALEVCSSLGISLLVLETPNIDVFTEAIVSVM